MDLIKSGELLRTLRKSKSMTQKEVADKLGILPKTVSKWETGRGFPDVSMLTSLAEILGVSEKILLSGSLSENKTDAGNIKRTKFYVCPCCGSFMQGVGNCQVMCCGKVILPASPQKADNIKVSEADNDFYVEFNHEMTKEHYISFASFIGFDRVLTIKLYPEQESAVRFPKMFRGNLYYYCNKHGLFEYKIK